MANIICINCMKGTLNEQGVCNVCGKNDEQIETSHRHLPLRTILRGKYLMGKVIGEGGFGITYLGYDLDLEIRVAIKEFCPREFAGRDARDGLTICPFDKESAEFFDAEKEKFINEAKRLAKFRGEQGIVSVLDYFKENGTAYIVMEYIDGVTLKAFQKMVGKRMEPYRLLNLLEPVMDGLSKLHANGIIHRDISPDNIMIDTAKQRVYLIDFGTAREINHNEEKSLSVYKKGGYTPIEQQSRHGNQGPWTDVYALCATIYRCITGVSIPDANNRLMGDEVIKPSAMGIAISPQIEEALLCGLAVKPEDRTQSMEALMAVIPERFGAAFLQVNDAPSVKTKAEPVENESERTVSIRIDSDSGNVTTTDLARLESLIQEARRSYGKRKSFVVLRNIAVLLIAGITCFLFVTVY